MRSPIRIGFLAASILFLLPSFGAFAQTRPAPLPPLDSLDFRDMLDISGDLFGKATNMEAQVAEMLEKANGELQISQTQLAEAKADTTLAKTVLDSLTKVAKTSKSVQKKTAQQLERAKKASALTGAMTDMIDSLSLRKSLPKAWQQVCQLHDELYPPLPTEKPEKEAVATDEPKKAEAEKVKPIPLPGAKKYSAAADVMLHPPTPPCVIASSSRDEFSGEISREMAKAELFRYTNPALKTYLQGKTHVICEAALASTGSKATLLLTFNINDPNARKAFGRLEKNSIATLKFLDGTIFELQNAIADDGVFTPDNDASIFRAQYPLNPEALKKIRRTGIDKLRILWSKGFDDYDVQQVDLLRQQAECLFK